IKSGTEFSFLVDETQQLHVGIVKRTGATIDAVSQTIKVFASFSKPAKTVMPGMSGTARF
ncbi:MAG: efflux RND transporter periplasmic adaptor subunit, partial [Rhizobiaceae bacterium]